MIRVALLLVLAVGTARADVELWTEVGVERELTKRIAVTFDQQTRFDAGVSRLGALIPELAARVRLKRWLRVATAYRLEYERDGDDELVLRHRIDTSLRARADAGPLRISVEAELQEHVRPDSRERLRHVVRDSVELAWRGDAVTPAISLAAFHRLGGGMTGRFDKLWLTAGCVRAFEARDVELFYRLELPRADPDDPITHIVGVAVHSEL